MTLSPDNANFTQAEAKARRQESKRQIIEILENVPMPYALRIHKAIKAAHLDLPYQHVCTVLRKITTSRRYFEATAEADHRMGLDGEESELLEEHKQFAVEKLKPRKKAVAQSKPDSGVIRVTKRQRPATQHPVSL